VGASVKRINAEALVFAVAAWSPSPGGRPAFKLFDERSETFRHRLSQFGVAGMKCNDRFRY